MSQIDEFEEQVASVPWASLEHAHGKATDTPGRLRAIWANDPDEIVAGYTHLWSALLGQGRVWPATAPAARLLTLLIADDLFGGNDPSLRAGVLAFFRQIGRLANASEPQCSDVLSELFDSAMSFLDHPHPPTAGAATAACVALLPSARGADTCERLRAWLEGAASHGTVAYRAGAIIGLGELGERPEPWLDHPLPGLRLAAALAPALAQDERATRRLLELSLSPRALDYVLSPMLAPENMSLVEFDGRPVAVVVAEALCARVADTDRLLPCVVAALPMAGTGFAAEILGLYLERVASAVFAPGGRALATAVACTDDLWSDSEFVELLGRSGLPQERGAWREYAADCDQIAPDELVRGLTVAIGQSSSGGYSVEAVGHSIRVVHVGQDCVGTLDGRLYFNGVPPALRSPLDRLARASLRASLRAFSGGSEYALEVLDRLPMGAWELVGAARQAGFTAEFELDPVCTT